MSLIERPGLDLHIKAVFPLPVARTMPPRKQKAFTGGQSSKKANEQQVGSLDGLHEYFTDLFSSRNLKMISSRLLMGSRLRLASGKPVMPPEP